MIDRLLGFAVATAVALAPATAGAQKGLQVLDFFLQQADRELQRQQQLEYERQQRQDLNRLQQQFRAQWQACHRQDLDACDQALAYPYLNVNDRQVLLNKRMQIIAQQHETAERARREREEVVERERAAEAARQREEQQRRRRADEAERERLATQAQILLKRQEEERQNAAMLLWVLSALLALAIAGVSILLIYIFRGGAIFRRQSSDDATTQPEPAFPPAAVRDTTAPATPSPTMENADKPRDTAGALSALELAHAYLEEVREAKRPDLDDEASRKHQLNTLSLAAKQLDLARKLDNAAVFEGERDGLPYRYTINELKAEALLLEGSAHQLYDLKRAIPALTKATELDPNNPRAFFLLGLTHAANMKKAPAVAALQQAVALDPKNLTYRKELNRAESLSGAEIAAYHATRAGEKMFDAGIKTANAGILLWNVFAITWNVLTFPLRLALRIAGHR